MRLILALFILGFPVIALAQTPFGKWKTIDDDTGEAKSIVEIYQKMASFMAR